MSVNDDQQNFWTDQAGPKWVAQQAAMDALLQPVLDLVLDTAALKPGEQVLDIGCGAGASTAAAQGLTGAATGVDISPTLLDQARKTVPQAAFMEADAQTDPLGGPYDAMISRFGVMFFADPTAAFQNLARHLRPGGRMTLVAWGPAPQNPYFMVPAKVAARVVGQPPKTDRTQPGPFAFEDADRVRGLLSGTGLSDLAITETAVTLTPPGTVQDMAELCTVIGPAQSVLRQFDAEDSHRAPLIDALTEALAVWDTPEGLRIPATLNLITATRPSASFSS